MFPLDNPLANDPPKSKLKLITIVRPDGTIEKVWVSESE